MSQKQQPDTVGDGGSLVGETLQVRWAPAETLRCSMPPLAPSRLCWWVALDDENLSSHTRPDEPDLLKVSTDLCSPAIFTPRLSPPACYDR